MSKSRKTAESPPAADLERYDRQMRFAPLGEAGQRRLLAGRVTLIGCGALGSVIANTLVRAGVGCLRIVDRDCIELSNLQRQVLFSEDDIASGLPKAEAARRCLQRVNTSVTVEAVIDEASPGNIEALAEHADLLLDGTDNFQTRYLINDLAVKTGRPWVFGAVAGARGLVMPILPGQTPCLRCVFEQGLPPELNRTADTDGILAPAVQTVAAHQAMEAIKILAGCLDAVDRRLWQLDLWSGRHVPINVAGARDASCPCCGQGRFEYLQGHPEPPTTRWVGHQTVQVFPREPVRIGFAALARRLESQAGIEVRFNPYMLRARLEDLQITLFADGRAIVRGTDDPAAAQAVCERMIRA